LSDIVLAVHGGAGRLAARRLKISARKKYEEGLASALRVGQKILLRGGSALVAVTETVAMLEDDELFNAGRGAVLTADGTVELSASVMRGRDRAAGAMVGLKRTKNPVYAANALLNHSHILLFGQQADRFAEQKGLAMVPSPYFYTAARKRQWQRLKDSDDIELDHSIDEPQGTVGAIARDRRGRLAAATSTGGLVNQLSGRVGDTPVIGSGTWADDRVCAVSATGKGDAFFRIGFARRVADLIELSGLSAAEAAVAALQEVKDVKGEGGCIVLDSTGSLAIQFNSMHMLRGWVRGDSHASVAILPDETLVCS
jgi:beta-aspartyl-peptidase (threonine type)